MVQILPNAAASLTAELAAKPQRVDRGSSRRTSTAAKRMLARLLVRRRTWMKRLRTTFTRAPGSGSDGARHDLQAAAIDDTVALRDGTAVRLRAIRPDDKERLRAAFERLSFRSVRRRFFHAMTELTPEQLRNFTEPDFRDHVGLVLSVEDETGERLIAVARYIRAGPGSAEFAITVADEYQNRGAGFLLLQQLLRIARASGVRELIAHVLEDNRPMLKVIRRTNLTCRQTFEDGVYCVVMSLVED